MAREQIDRRINFSEETRVVILEKSRGRCAHCGKSLNKKDATIEHIIPLSKGGKNIPINLVCLCKFCNEEKDDFIVRPQEYYGYLDAKYLPEIKSLYDSFIENGDWLTSKNYTTEDYFTIKYPMSLRSLQGNNKKNSRNVYSATATVKKARYEDLDKISEFTKKYHEKYNLDASEVKDVISDFFSGGAIYMIYKQSELAGVIPVHTEKRKISETEECYSFSVGGIPCLYSKNNIYLIEQALAHIFFNIASMNNQAISFFLMIPENDQGLLEFCECRGNKWGELCDENETWREYIFLIDEKQAQLARTTSKMKKIVIKTSEFIQKSMKLCPINKEKKQDINNKKATVNYKNKKKRIREEEADDYFYDYAEA